MTERTGLTFYIFSFIDSRKVFGVLFSTFLIVQVDNGILKFNRDQRTKCSQATFCFVRSRLCISGFHFLCLLRKGSWPSLFD